MYNLNFDVVRSMIRYNFKNSDIKINIRVYTGFELLPEDKFNLINEQHITHHI